MQNDDRQQEVRRKFRLDLYLGRVGLGLYVIGLILGLASDESEANAIGQAARRVGEPMLLYAAFATFWLHQPRRTQPPRN
jgi:hypothetical protein